MSLVSRYVKPLLRPAKRTFDERKWAFLYGGIEARMPLTRLGTEYGGFDVALNGLNESSIVYSFGIGEDVSFDLQLIERIGCTVHGFDPTPRSLEWAAKQDLPTNFVVRGYGLSDHDGVELFVPPDNPNHISHSFVRENPGKWPAIELPVRTLRSIMSELGHSRIDLLKMDIEGAEYRVLEDMLKSGVDITQIAIEFHPAIAGVAATRRHASMIRNSGYSLIAGYQAAGTVTYMK